MLGHSAKMLFLKKNCGFNSHPLRFLIYNTTNMELKFCEHCRSILLSIREKEFLTPYYYVVCGTCGDCSTIEDSEHEAVIAWNEGKRLKRSERLWL